MFLLKIVFSAVACLTVTNYIFVTGQDDQQTPPTEGQPLPPSPSPPQSGPEVKPSPDPLDEGGQPGEEPVYEKTDPPPPEHHTYVALIDIVFTDGRKRTCTGTIIHTNVVITAAHCFIDNNAIDAELTASFVVIGTKKMYDTGYENYLPIERVITHPKYKGWTADIALVYTFASMTDDKPGNVIPIIGESALTPVDSNVTILSWGHCKDDVTTNTRQPLHAGENKRICSSEDDNHESCEVTSPKPLRQGSSTEHERSSEQDGFPQRSQFDKSQQHGGMAPTTSRMGVSMKPAQRLSQYSNRENYNQRSHERQGITPSNRYSSRESNGKKSKFSPNPLIPIRMDDTYPTKQRQFRQNSSMNGNMDYEYALLGVQVRARASNDEYMVPTVKLSSAKGDMRLSRNYSSMKNVIKDRRREIMRRRPSLSKKRHISGRRTVGAKENKLTIEIFGFVNVQTCKKLVDRVLPAIYAINTNEVVCYAAEEHFISDDDSGAPAIRQGHLVAVTLGGVECEGDHVAIGIKMNCFCSWIAENLPEKDINWKCCKNCCTGSENKPHSSSASPRNKYLYKK
ncbi:unnamed protein product [Spodoptera littoralis]|uniref:Peptidase S1 domain-containing protein n=1 Tax=Spodoptera littoralis TaxID=7109 RepID=A0A9P0N0P4_SPOLI|nr:unnamed protein product [Spodoptera littoralis]CAH1635600.1 unnamed protein product [Spodoptera littoralis]